MTSPGNDRLTSLLRRAVDVEPHEVAALLTAFSYFFCVLSSYFILRPMRDAVAAATGVRGLPWLFTGTLTATLVFNPLFSALVVRFPARKFIPIAYHFFIANLLGFYLLMRFVSGGQGSPSDLWIGRAFFIWLSVFNLFVVSIFWCFMADVFRSEQAKRLFGFIAVGGTMGSVTGSLVTASLAPRLGPMNLLLISAVLLELAVLAVVYFPTPAAVRVGGSLRTQPDAAPIGGSIWAGVASTVRSPYLAGISAFLVLYLFGSAFLFAQQSELVGRYYPDQAQRVAVLGWIELAAQSLTLVAQIFFTGRIIRWIGLAGALAFLPILSMLGFGILGVAPAFVVIGAFNVLRRAGNFALTNPAMEVLFTVVPREDKYKAKSFIETFVYRGGDQIGIWIYAGLIALGLSFSTIAFLAVPMAAVWLVLGLWLGRRHTAMAANPTSR